MNVKEVTSVYEPALASGCELLVWPLWFLLAVTCIVESP